jgi:hypothetical protein
MEYEQGVMIKFLADEIEEKLRARLIEDASSLRMVQFWVAEVKRGREDIHDEPRPGQHPAADLMRKDQEVLDHSPFEYA